jgi:hypothetical protein
MRQIDPFCVRYLTDAQVPETIPNGGYARARSVLADCWR